MSRYNQYQKYNTEDFVQDPVFRKWATGSDEESQLFWKKVLSDHPEIEDKVQTAKEIVKALYFKEKPIKKEFYDDSLNILKAKIENRKESTLKIIYQWWAKAAAILLIPLIFTGIYFLNSDFANNNLGVIEYYTPEGQKSNVVLPDGTNIWLNSGTKLSYFLNSKSGERKVKLDGEAYFNVAKNKKKSFLVETNRYTVKVYGTSFNVRAYANQNETETILEEGSVSILNKYMDELKMKPGQQFTLNSENKYKLKQINTDLYVCWKNNLLKVNNERLQDLVLRMERWYGVNISVKDFDQVKDLRYTLTVKTESLRETLELMRVITDFEYSINGEKVSLKYNQKEYNMN